MKYHCKNDCSRLRDVESTVLVIDIPKEMLELYLEHHFTPAKIAHDNYFLCRRERHPVYFRMGRRALISNKFTRNLPTRWEQQQQQKKKRKSSWKNIYQSVKMCNEIAHFTLTLIKLFVYAVENALYSLAEEGFQLFSPWKVRHNTQRVNYLM